MNDALQVQVSVGFDILGMAISQSRAEIKAVLVEKGFTKNIRWSDVVSYTDGTVRALDVWQKGVSDFSADTPEDTINITYNTVSEGEADHALVLGRRWYIPEAANLAISTLKTSLEDKHGASAPGFEKRFYDREGIVSPRAYEFVCAEDIHIQAVQVPTVTIGSIADVSASPACGAVVDLMTIASGNLASQMHVTLFKGDLIYEDFWKTWSAQELQALQERYELQANMTGTTPDL